MNTVSKLIFTFFLLISFFSCTEQKNNQTIVSQPIKKDCLYSFDESKTRVFWAGYKTDDKLKVIGQFNELKTDRTYQQFSSLEDLVNGINFSINSASSASGDEIRDLNLKEYFFQFFTENFQINGSLAEMNNDSITATINIFGIAKNIALSYSIENEKLKMKGTFSLQEFGVFKAYNSIHKKCFDLHKGKTWDDVDVIIEVPILKDCK